MDMKRNYNSQSRKASNFFATGIKAESAFNFQNLGKIQMSF